MSLPNLKTSPAVHPDSTRLTIATSSGLLAASGVVLAEPGVVTGLTATTDGTNDATVILYDNAAAAAGTVLAKLTVKGANVNGTLDMYLPIRASAGVYLSLTGTGANALVWYLS